jgi:dihydrofolate synthase/folylpolyglutamate synthase
MNYQQTVDYLYALFPDFQKDGAVAYKPGTDAIQRLCSAVGNPQREFLTVHIAGTNGKGSVASMLAAVLQSAGYKVGLYTSPHLVSFCERIKVDGKEIAQQAVIDFAERCSNTSEQLRPSFFEVTTAMAFDYFAQQGIDIAVVEAGLGGRFDSTNVITPIVSVITHIALDHCNLLGDTLEKIAAEKAGIIKHRIPVVIGKHQNETNNIFKHKAWLNNAPILFADQRYKVRESYMYNGLQIFSIQRDNKPPHTFTVELMGIYQQQNVCTVLTTIDVLIRNRIDISSKNIANGLRHVSTLTNLLGRWQTIQTHPTIVCDIAHNADGIAQTMAQLRIEMFHYRQLHIVFGISADKDLSSILEYLPRDAHYYFTQAQSSRAMPAVALAETCAAAGLHGVVTNNVRDAINLAKSNTSDSDFIYIGGSAFVVAEAIGNK